MIPRHRKICKTCGRETYLFSHGECKGCNMRSKASYGGVYRRSGFRGTSTLPERQSGLKRTYIQPRSDKRIEQEKEYAKIKPKNKECIFCGEGFVKNERKDKHHLKGRKGKNLTNERYIFYVHRKCHSLYHYSSIERISWFTGFLLRLREVDRYLYEKELNKYDK